jgi:hypothetical protein
MVQDGEMRRSEDALDELMRRGTSAALWTDMLAVGRLVELSKVAAKAKCSDVGVGGSPRQLHQ